VLVISACYSGGFIPPPGGCQHHDQYRAAKPPAGPYGCGNDSLITDFSRAFYDKGLRTTYSFESAFRFAQDYVYKE